VVVINEQIYIVVTCKTHEIYKILYVTNIRNKGLRVDRKLLSPLAPNPNRKQDWQATLYENVD
jgi:hypothetical protein